MNNFTLIENPLIQDIGLKLHDTNTTSSMYREYTQLLGLYMGIDLAQRGILPLKEKTTNTPLGKLSTKVVDDEQIGIVNVLRAGTNMALGMGQAFPNSPIAFVSAWRNTVRGKIVASTDYTRGIECLKDRYVVITDPALATGSSVLASIDVCKEYIDTKKTIICCLHAASEGIEAIYKEYSDIHIYSVFGPSKLNEKYYIVNGPGDCGDRCFNT